MGTDFSSRSFCVSSKDALFEIGFDLVEESEVLKYNRDVLRILGLYVFKLAACMSHAV